MSASEDARNAARAQTDAQTASMEAMSTAAEARSKALAELAEGAALTEAASHDRAARIEKSRDAIRRFNEDMERMAKGLPPIAREDDGEVD